MASTVPKSDDCADKLLDAEQSEQSGKISDGDDKHTRAETQVSATCALCVFVGIILLIVGVIIAAPKSTDPKYVTIAAADVWVVENNTATKCITVDVNRVCLEEAPRLYYTVALASDGDRSRVVCKIPLRLETLEAVAEAVRAYTMEDRVRRKDDICYQYEPPSKVAAYMMICGGISILGGLCAGFCEMRQIDARRNAQSAGVPLK